MEQNMGKLSAKLRIGEKIGFGFGLVGLLFIGVIWQYHNTLQQSLADYQQLQDISGAKKSHALAIENSMLEARNSGKDFLIHRDEASVREVSFHLEHVLRDTADLRKIDEPAAQTADRIAELMNIYHQRFQMVVDAWRKKGLDHNSGLQGAFRDTVHELEAIAGHFKVDRIYLQLLQIRRGEKDLGLRREQQYRSNVLRLVEEFKEKIGASELESGIKARLLEEIETYRETFEVYADAVLMNEEIHGGKGPFRQAAHRIESILNAHYVSDLERNILQLRRREKDYLLRDDKIYVNMALQELQLIHAQVEASTISAEDKARFIVLMQNYRKDFLALVEQNDLIDRLNDEMRKAVSEIILLAKENVDFANQMMNKVATSINAASNAKAHLMLWIVAVAVLLGVFFAVSITLRIARPLRQMAGLLDRLAFESPAERMPFVSGGRDEVNAMAESVNTMADNRARFVAWWETSMQEADACQKLEKTLTQALETDAEPARELPDAEKELWKAIAAKRELLSKQNQDISRLNGRIIEKAERLGNGPTGEIETEIAINTIRHSARSIQNIVNMASFQEDSKKVVE